MDKHVSVQMESEEFLKGPATLSFSATNGVDSGLRTVDGSSSAELNKSILPKRNSVTAEDDGVQPVQNGGAMFTPLSPFPVSDGYGVNPFSSSSFTTRSLSVSSVLAQLHSLDNPTTTGTATGGHPNRRLGNGNGRSLDDNVVDQVFPTSPGKALRSTSSTMPLSADSISLVEDNGPNGMQEDSSLKQDDTIGLIHSSSFSSLSSSSSSSFSSTELESTVMPYLFSPAQLATDITESKGGDGMEDGRRKSQLSIVSSPLASARNVVPTSFHTLEETIGVVMTSPGRRSSVLSQQHNHQHHHHFHQLHRFPQVSANVIEPSDSVDVGDSLLLNEDSDEEKSDSPRRKSRRISNSQAHARAGSISGEITSNANPDANSNTSLAVSASDGVNVSDIGADEMTVTVGAVSSEGVEDSDSDYVPNGEAEEELAAEDAEDEEEDEEDDEEELRHDQFGVLGWIYSQRERGKSPASTLSSLLSFFPPDLGKREAKNVLWNAAMSVGIHLSKALAKHERRRKKLLAINSMDDAVALIRHSSRIVVLTGAGVSVSAGIPDFRSKGGIYVRLKEEFGCESPEDMFDLAVFKENPKMFYSFAREVYPAAYNPTLTHKFVSLLEEKGKLLRNFTQNIDNLEEKAKINKVLQCHGSFATASCITCKYKVKGTEIEKQIMAKEIAYCPKCHSADALQERANSANGNVSADVSYGVMKPDIIFFSEPLPSTFHQALEEDRGVADLVIVIGSSLKVHPVAGMLSTFPSTVPMILINREVVGFPDHFDIELLGDCDIICAELAKRLNWQVAHDNFGDYSQQDIAFKFFSPNRYVFPRAAESLEEVENQIVDSGFYSSLYRPAMTHPEKDFFSELNRERKRKRVEAERKKTLPMQHKHTPTIPHAAAGRISSRPSNKAMITVVDEGVEEEEEGQTGRSRSMNEHVEQHERVYDDANVHMQSLEGNDKERGINTDASATETSVTTQHNDGEGDGKDSSEFAIHAGSAFSHRES